MTKLRPDEVIAGQFVKFYELMPQDQLGRKCRGNIGQFRASCKNTPRYYVDTPGELHFKIGGNFCMDHFIHWDMQVRNIMRQEAPVPVKVKPPRRKRAPKQAK